MIQHEITIEGMSCGHCVMAVKKELSKLSGVTIESVQIGKAIVQCDDTKVTQAMLKEAVEEAGYKIMTMS